MKLKYYGIRFLAALLFMGSFGGGFLAGAEYGKWVGWTTFIVLAGMGLFLHRIADKFRQ
ncbi:MAG: hypothetical protein WA240_11415 [Nitrospirota bacterium]